MVHSDGCPTRLFQYLEEDHLVCDTWKVLSTLALRGLKLQEADMLSWPEQSPSFPWGRPCPAPPPCLAGPDSAGVCQLQEGPMEDMRTAPQLAV